MHHYLLHNDEIREAGDKIVSPGQVGLLSGWGVFSTLRITRGILFAFERHFARMKRDAARMRVPFPADSAWLEARLVKLIAANGVQEATLRVAIVRNKGGIWQGPGIQRDFDVVAFTTDVAKWGQGVRLSVVPNARYADSPFAGAKILSWSDNLSWYEEAHERGFDEVVLLNERAEVSECTSANIFIVVGGQVWTPPLSAGCLPGITREILLSEIKVPGVSLGERTLRLTDLEAADEVFITSTTRYVLPVEEVEGLSIRPPGPISARLRSAFEAYVEEYACSRV
jgi:branched-chain amino acid aminotransferase